MRKHLPLLRSKSLRCSTPYIEYPIHCLATTSGVFAVIITRHTRILPRQAVRLYARECVGFIYFRNARIKVSSVLITNRQHKLHEHTRRESRGALAHCPICGRDVAGCVCARVYMRCMHTLRTRVAAIDRISRMAERKRCINRVHRMRTRVFGATTRRSARVPHHQRGRRTEPRAPSWNYASAFPVCTRGGPICILQCHFFT